MKSNIAYENCPRFQRCNINDCPLDESKGRINHPEDISVIKKDKCASKNCRLRIGKQFNLKNKGMKSREFAYYKSNTPQKQKQSKFTHTNQEKTAKKGITEVGLEGRK